MGKPISSTYAAPILYIEDVSSVRQRHMRLLSII